MFPSHASGRPATDQFTESKDAVIAQVGRLWCSSCSCLFLSSTRSLAGQLLLASWHELWQLWLMWESFAVCSPQCVSSRLIVEKRAVKQTSRCHVHLKPFVRSYGMRGGGRYPGGAQQEAKHWLPAGACVAGGTRSGYHVQWPSGGEAQTAASASFHGFR